MRHQIQQKSLNFQTIPKNFQLGEESISNIASTFFFTYNNQDRRSNILAKVLKETKNFGLTCFCGLIVDSSNPSEVSASRQLAAAWFALNGSRSIQRDFCQNYQKKFCNPVPSHKKIRGLLNFNDDIITFKICFLALKKFSPVDSCFVCLFVFVYLWTVKLVVRAGHCGAIFLVSPVRAVLQMYNSIYSMI